MEVRGKSGSILWRLRFLFLRSRHPFFFKNLPPFFYLPWCKIRVRTARLSHHIATHCSAAEKPYRVAMRWQSRANRHRGMRRCRAMAADAPRWRRQSTHAIIGLSSGNRHRAQTLPQAQIAEHTQRPEQPAPALDRDRAQGLGSLPSQPALGVDGLSGRPVYRFSAGSRSSVHCGATGARGAL